MARKLASFIDGYMNYTEGKGSPALYRKWTAIYLVGAALERKVWVKTAKGKLFPNQYIILVGPAGIGKSLCTSTARELIIELNSVETPIHLAPVSVTKASLIDALANAERRVVRPLENPPVTSFNSLVIIPNELGVFLPSWESDFMNTLTDLWDCGPYSETRRTSRLSIDLPRTQLNMLSATTPAHMQGMLPEGAWDTGFMSRTICVYSGDVQYVDLFAEFAFDERLRTNLDEDFRDIHGLFGQMDFSDDAKETIRAWAKSGGEPIPDHPKLHSYTMRRPAHLLKLCMVACAAAGDGMTITLDHVAEALDWLIEVEHSMPDIFKSMKAGGDGRAIEECWHFAYQIFTKEKQPVAEHRLVSFLQERVPAHNVVRILDVMERARLIEKKFMESGGIGYQPRSKRAA